MLGLEERLESSSHLYFLELLLLLLLLLGRFSPVQLCVTP